MINLEGNLGAFIAGNISTVITLLCGAGWGVWLMAKLHSRVEDNTKDINAAHEKIRELEKDLYKKS